MSFRYFLRDFWAVARMFAVASAAGLGPVDAAKLSVPWCAHPHTSNYSSGEIEATWMRRGANNVGKLCSTALQQLQEQHSLVDAWLGFTNSSFGVQARRPTQLERSAMSFMMCSNGREEPIEPLTGIARHPRASFGCHPHDVFNHDKFDITYLSLHNKCNEDKGGTGVKHTKAERRNIFYDLGASKYTEDPVTITRGSSLGSSIKLFSKLYERNCITFDDIYAWEARTYDPAEYWKAVPTSVRAKLHFMNIPVEDEPHEKCCVRTHGVNTRLV